VDERNRRRISKSLGIESLQKKSKILFFFNNFFWRNIELGKSSGILGFISLVGIRSEEKRACRSCSREREKNNNKRKLKKEREVKGNGELSNLGERGKGEMDTCRVEIVGYLLFLRLKMWREMEWEWESLFCCEL
jgi:hypothetical protein